MWTTVPWTKSAWSRTLESALPVFCSPAVMFVASGWGSVPSEMVRVVLLRERLAIVCVIAYLVSGHRSIYPAQRIARKQHAFGIVAGLGMVVRGHCGLSFDAVRQPSAAGGNVEIG